MYLDCNSDCLFFSESGYAECTGCRECAYCGSHLYWTGDKSKLHFDHIVPKISGGKTVVPVCHHCNLSKSAMSLKMWLRWVRYNDSSLWSNIAEHNNALRNNVAHVVREVRDE
jgi:5-methylcytosine-specific restriction endonuclease McrA